MVAIIPAAGRGTRMAEVTAGRAKEVLPLGGRPVIARIIEEARTADPDRIIVVSSRTKPELDAVARSHGAEIVYQESMRGLADAIAVTEVEDDVVILLGDCVYRGGSPIDRMANLVRRGIDGAIAVEETDDAGTRLYGIVEVESVTGGIRSILEKPGPEVTDSRWAVAARFALSIRTMAMLGSYLAATSVDGEIGFTPFVRQALIDGTDFKAVALAPGQQRVDCGSPEEYAAALSLEW